MLDVYLMLYSLPDLTTFVKLHVLELHTSFTIHKQSCMQRLSLVDYIVKFYNLSFSLQ